MAVLGFTVIAVFAVGLYMLPSFVAAGRKCKAAAGIVILNLLLGWTLLGWVGALIWAAVGEVKPAPVRFAA
jgi:hypothetical protein